MTQVGCMSKKYPNCPWYVMNLGDYFWKDDKGFIPILKNQSSNLVKMLQEDAVRVNVGQVQAKEYICVIRDPYERYISGIAEYIRNVGSIKEVQYNLDAGSFIFDKHTYPQSWFLIPFSESNIKVLRSNRETAKEVAKYMDVPFRIMRGNVTSQELREEINHLTWLYKKEIKMFLNSDYYYLKNLT